MVQDFRAAIGIGRIFPDPSEMDYTTLQRSWAHPWFDICEINANSANSCNFDCDVKCGIWHVRGLEDTLFTTKTVYAGSCALSDTSLCLLIKFIITQRRGRGWKRPRCVCIWDPHYQTSSFPYMCPFLPIICTMSPCIISRLSPQLRKPNYMTTPATINHLLESCIWCRCINLKVNVVIL